ncbi:MAG: cytochrome c biogenesis protein CcsA [Burkholderiales bacterium]|nr:cytochrome c biogenesis protein CcsA [Burkholderiales bacterium]MBK9347304.1 cytochrome c biogenesis protein CcsA [Burkholderiales bacterium]
MILASAPYPHLILSLGAAAAYAWPAVQARRISPRAARNWVVLAWLLHAGVLALGLFGEQAHFGFAPAMSVTAWLVAGVYGVESQIFPQLPTRWTLCALGTVAVLLAVFFPGNAIPVTASAWLALHLAFGVACYGLFGIAVVHAWFMTRAEARIRHAQDPHSGLPLLTLERLTYRFVGAGFVLLSATLLAGLLFGDTLYGHGHAWRWNHKTVFSTLAWLTFAILMVGRSAFGWRGRRAVHVLYTGSAFLLLAYVGSRFVMEIVLGRTA